MESEPTLTPREKAHLPGKKSPEEDGTEIGSLVATLLKGWCCRDSARAGQHGVSIL